MLRLVGDVYGWLVLCCGYFIVFFFASVLEDFVWRVVVEAAFAAVGL